MTDQERETIRRIFADLNWYELLEVMKDGSKMLDYKAKQLEEQIAFDNLMRGLWT